MKKSLHRVEFRTVTHASRALSIRSRRCAGSARVHDRPTTNLSSRGRVARIGEVVRAARRGRRGHRRALAIMSSSNPAPEFDPFFSLGGSGEWNACIGRQGDEENYVDGYMEAALELANAVIDKGQHGKRDTLAMPILYNARHAVELSLKFVITRLCEAGVIAAPSRKNHDIKAHWEHISAAKLGDSQLRAYISRLKPFVDSLHRMDSDGQQLRYAETRDGQQSLPHLAVCDLEVIRHSLTLLSELLATTKNRVHSLIEERATHTYTAACSRADLFRIAKMLPPRAKWSHPEFAAARADVMRDLDISGGQFSDAVDIIERHRKMGSLLGHEFSLTYLTDDHALFVVREWSKIHPPRTGGDDLVIDFFDPARIRRSRGERKARELVIESVLSALSPEEIADLETIFYIGRERYFCEVYERGLTGALKAQAGCDPLASVAHLMSKMNLLDALARGVEILGRPSLAASLRSLRPDLD